MMNLTNNVYGFAVSLVIMIGVMIIDYQTLVRISPVFYGLFIILLIEYYSHPK